jgi:hypothetical protein
LRGSVRGGGGLVATVAAGLVLCQLAVLEGHLAVHHVGSVGLGAAAKEKTHEALVPLLHGEAQDLTPKNQVILSTLTTRTRQQSDR